MAVNITSLTIPVLLILAGGTEATERTLVIPQVEGERQGTIIGRAIACGIEAERTDRILRMVRERMLSKVGRAMTDERFVPELNQAIFFETNLPTPSETAVCMRAIDAIDRLERGE